MGDFTSAQFSLDGIRKGASLVSKQLALDQCFGDGGTVNRDEEERVCGGSGNGWLLKPTLSPSRSHPSPTPSIWRSDLPDKVEDLFQFLALPDHLSEIEMFFDALSEIFDLLLKGLIGQGSVHDEAQLIHIKRLGHIIVCSEFSWPRPPF